MVGNRAYMIAAARYRIWEGMSELPEPSSVALKAAFRLLKEINKSPVPPNLDMLATMIDETLRYSEAISLIEEAAVHFDASGSLVQEARACQDFVDWARS